MVLGLLSACDPTELTDSLRARAAYDFECPRSDLLLTDLTREGALRSTFGVRGCGHRATYVYGSGGQWVINSELVSAKPKRAPARDDSDNDSDSDSDSDSP